jgi:hypothetical protein
MFIAQIIPLMLIRKQTAMCIAQIVCLTLIRKQTAMCNAQIVPLMSIRKQMEISISGAEITNICQNVPALNCLSLLSVYAAYFHLFSD